MSSTVFYYITGHLSQSNHHNSVCRSDLGLLLFLSHNIKTCTQGSMFNIISNIYRSKPFFKKKWLYFFLSTSAWWRIQMTTGTVWYHYLCTQAEADYFLLLWHHQNRYQHSKSENNHLILFWKYFPLPSSVERPTHWKLLNCWPSPQENMSP